MSGLHPEDVQKLQWLYDVVRGIDGDNIRWSGNSLYIGTGGGDGDKPGTDWKPRQFRVKSEENDYLVCVPYNSKTQEAGEREVKVAKPADFRGGAERWGVYPAYVPETSVVWAAPFRANGATDADDVPILLMDMNIDGRSADGFWAEVDGSSAIAGENNQWTYTATEQDQSADGWSDLTDGRSVSAVINGAEANNSDAGVQGNGIDIDGTVFDDNSDIEVQPIQGNPVRWVVRTYDKTTGAAIYAISATNAVDGECA